MDLPLTYGKLRTPSWQQANLTKRFELVNGFLDNGNVEYVLIDDSKQTNTVYVIGSNPKLRINHWWGAFDTLQYQINMLLICQPSQ